MFSWKDSLFFFLIDSMGLLETHFIDISTEVVPMNYRAVTQGLSDKKNSQIS